MSVDPADRPVVILEENFIDNADEVFAWLLTEVDWDRRMKARMTASFGRPYDYAGISYPETPMPPQLQRICELLEARLGFLPNNCLVNYYPDGSSKMGFHADSLTELAADTGVAIVSLGGSRPLRFRRMGDPTVQEVASPDALPAQATARWELTQLPGSMLYMGQDVHRHWVHAIPRRHFADPRISLTFRQLKNPQDFGQEKSDSTGGDILGNP